jgi:hypothetical protein
MGSDVIYMSEEFLPQWTDGYWVATSRGDCLVVCRSVRLCHTRLRSPTDPVQLSYTWD